MPQQPEQLGQFRQAMETANGITNLFFISCTGVAATFYPFIRTRFGPRYFGLIQLSGLPISWLFAVTTCLPHTIWPFTFFTYAYLLVRFFQRFVTGKALRAGYYHSRYNGYPLVCKYLSVSELTAKAFVEPLIIGGLGIAVLLITQHSFGIFMIVGSVAMLIDHAQLVDYQRRKAWEIRDQEILNQSMSKELERMR
jgi:hypothetical protein